jgi:hypothetical protein
VSTKFNTQILEMHSKNTRPEEREAAWEIMEALFEKADEL